MKKLFLKLFCALTRNPIPMPGQRWYYEYKHTDPEKAFARVVTIDYLVPGGMMVKGKYIYGTGREMHSGSEHMTAWELLNEFRCVTKKTVLFNQ